MTLTLPTGIIRKSGPLRYLRLWRDLMLSALPPSTLVSWQLRRTR